MQDVKKIEIIIDTFHIQDVLNILDQIKVSGYTVIKDTSGKGDRGISCSDYLDCDFTGSYIMTVCTNEKQLNTLIELIKPLLKKVGGICLFSDAKWVIH
ncbi:Nitrogen regulatory protein P-II [Planktothrix serta PCC 8927]|uniref:Nitrogen regulatory protein P-II n=1 Tax=Planktothrix serta PCC 8927 TaxID=671068 RepID=A0A7Z9DZP4_9CYAN|nr:P-II family nitrogen regulator [Planktothrix serta]VXD20256.1 Nitrogen regulatory protein P-II [Planktothrix serta PCC 8927]